MGPVNIILLALMFVSGILTALLVLMHSGKGTGVSDMIASSMYNSTAGSGIVEKNLDRLTVITAIVFGLSVIIMMLTFPLGTIEASHWGLWAIRHRARWPYCIIGKSNRWVEHGL